MHTLKIIEYTLKKLTTPFIIPLSNFFTPFQQGHPYFKSTLSNSKSTVKPAHKKYLSDIQHFLK